VLKEQSSRATTASARQAATTNGGRVLFDYTSALNGFAARLPDAALTALRSNPTVAYIEADRRVSIDTDQPSPTWGLDRVDQRKQPMNALYRYRYTGKGVRAYVIDSGVRTTHQEFTGRTAAGFSSITDGNGTADCNGHGTHVAGTLGGTTYGVAKRVTVIPVRVLDCAGDGTTATVIAGVDFVAGHHTAGQPAVANMSLGGGASSSLDTSVENLIADGVFVAVAAGNETTDACNVSPARVPAAVTVGATDSFDDIAGFSNFGTCLDLFAPGVSITSAWFTSDSTANTINGTSMASPHVAGAGALYLQAHRGASPASVSKWLRRNSTVGAVGGAGSSPNRLLYSVEAGTPPPPPGPPPSGKLLQNPGFENGAGAWTVTPHVVLGGPDIGIPARSGSWRAALVGFGSTGSDTLSQTVTLPGGTGHRVSFHVRIDTDEFTASSVYDWMKVQVVSGGVTKTLKKYSNLNATDSYVKRAIGLDAFAGQTITLRFVAAEDSSLATWFVVDDVVVR